MGSALSFSYFTENDELNYIENKMRYLAAMNMFFSSTTELSKELVFNRKKNKTSDFKVSLDLYKSTTYNFSSYLEL